MNRIEQTIRRLLGGHVPDKYYVHGDEPFWCPLCNGDFYRWQWDEAEKRDPNYRKNYYNPMLVRSSEGNKYYKLMCPRCARLNKAEIIGAQEHGTWKRVSRF